MNQFEVLSYDDTGDTSTNNLPRKLEKKKRKYERNPTEDLKKQIDELEKALNPPISKRYKKNKKKEEEIDLEEEYLKHRDYWYKYRKNEEKRKQKEKEEKERIHEERRRNKRNEKKQEKEDKESERKFYENIKRKNENKRRLKIMSLPDDVKDFINNEPTKKAYHKLCLKYHPDKCGNDEYFKIINNHMNP